MGEHSFVLSGFVSKSLKMGEVLGAKTGRG